jgi:hypothetical protein
MKQETKVLVVGVGDLGSKIALGLASSQTVQELVIAGRQVDAGLALERIASACGECRVRFVRLDAGRFDDVSELLRRETPSLVVQAASLLSPWFFRDRQDRTSHLFRQAGFAAHVCAQLPIIRVVMEAVRAAKYSGPVVNCSYPDVTHPILSRLQLAPTTGVGNAGMIHRFVGSRLRARGVHKFSLQVLAHHSDVSPIANSCQRANTPADAEPKIYVDGSISPIAADLLYGAPPVTDGGSLNFVTASHALALIHALTSWTPSLKTSVPGPFGLPGGWPVLVDKGKMQLDLPDGLSVDAGVHCQSEAAKFDGIEDIAADGTVTFTESARSFLRLVSHELAAPMHPDEAMSRFARMREVLRE